MVRVAINLATDFGGSLLSMGIARDVAFLSQFGVPRHSARGDGSLVGPLNAGAACCACSII